MILKILCQSLPQLLSVIDILIPIWFHISPNHSYIYIHFPISLNLLSPSWFFLMTSELLVHHLKIPCVPPLFSKCLLHLVRLLKCAFLLRIRLPCSTFKKELLSPRCMHMACRWGRRLSYSSLSFLATFKLISFFFSLKSLIFENSAFSLQCPSMLCFSTDWPPLMN